MRCAKNLCVVCRKWPVPPGPSRWCFCASLPNPTSGRGSKETTVIFCGFYAYKTMKMISLPFWRNMRWFFGNCQYFCCWWCCFNIVSDVFAGSMVQTWVGNNLWDLLARKFKEWFPCLEFSKVVSMEKSSSWWSLHVFASWGPTVSRFPLLGIMVILESTQKSLHFWPSNMQFLHFFWIDIPAVQVGGALYGFNGQALLSCNWLPRRGDPCSGIAHQVPSISETTLKRRGCPTWREQRQNSAFITRNWWRL